MESQQKKRGRPKGSLGKKKSKTSPAIRRNQLHHHQSEPIFSAPQPNTSANSSVSNSEIENKADSFETIAAHVPDVIGGPEAIPGAPDLVAEAGEAPDAALDEFQLNHATVKFYLEMGFDYAATKAKDPRWRLDKEELEVAVPATLPVAKKWLAMLLENSAYKEEIAFAIIMGGIVGPRLLMPKLQTNTAGTATPAS